MKNRLFYFHPEARQEFRGSIQWYRARSARAAADFRLEVVAAIRDIQQASERWPKYLYDTRRLVLQRFPFSVVYLDEVSRLVVVAVAHSKRKPGYWKRRI